MSLKTHAPVNCVDNFPNSGLSQSLLTSRAGLRHQRHILLSPARNINSTTSYRGATTCTESRNFCMNCCLRLRVCNDSRIIPLTVYTACNNTTAYLDNSSVLLVAFRGLGNFDCTSKLVLVSGAKVPPSAVLVLLC